MADMMGRQEPGRIYTGDIQQIIIFPGGSELRIDWTEGAEQYDGSGERGVKRKTFINLDNPELYLNGAKITPISIVGAALVTRLRAEFPTDLYDAATAAYFTSHPPGE